MYTDADKDFDQIKRGIEQRVKKQLVRHLAINPRADRRKIIDLQIEEERRRMRGALERVDVYDAVVPLDDWLRYFAKQLKERR